MSSYTNMQFSIPSISLSDELSRESIRERANSVVTLSTIPMHCSTLSKEALTQKITNCMNLPKKSIMSDSSGWLPWEEWLSISGNSKEAAASGLKTPISHSIHGSHTGEFRSGVRVVDAGNQRNLVFHTLNPWGDSGDDALVQLGRAWVVRVLATTYGSTQDQRIVAQYTEVRNHPPPMRGMVLEFRLPTPIVMQQASPEWPHDLFDQVCTHPDMREYIRSSETKYPLEDQEVWTLSWGIAKCAMALALNGSPVESPVPYEEDEGFYVD
jgi:hypothetical protein